MRNLNIKQVHAFFLLMCLSLLQLMVSSPAFASELQVLSPAQLSIGKPEEVLLQVTANQSFDGLIITNITNVNLSDPIFGFSKHEFRRQGEDFIYQRILSIYGLEPGPYTMEVQALNLTDSLMAAARVTGFVDYFDKEPPFVIAYSPENIVRSELVNITVQTNEEAVCRLDVNNVSFESMNTYLNWVELPVLQGLIHTTWMELSPGHHVFYASCKDASSNVMAPVRLKFEVNPAPAAKITLSDDSPVKAGVLEITLETSETLKLIPTLTYDFDGGDKTTISLTGSNNLWEGLLVIEDTDDQRVGTFHFSGVDLQGDTGTLITSGKIFLADTEDPPAPAGLQAISYEERIALEWYYDGEPLDYFRIYRSVTPTVGLANYYAKSFSESLIDYDTVGEQAYYYRVSAVDDAGNEGPLSNAATAVSQRKLATQEPQAEEQKPTKKILLADPLVMKVNRSLNYLESLYLDLDWVKTSFADAIDSDQQQIVSDLALQEKVSSTKAKLDQYTSQLKSFWYMDLSEKELDKRLNTVLENTDRLRAATPESIQVIERAVLTQVYPDTLFEQATEEVLLRNRLNQTQTASYIAVNRDLQDNIHVTTDIQLVDVKFFDGSHANVTLITKEVSYRGVTELNTIRLIEIIPKSVARRVDDISFLTTGYKVLRDDPVVEWQLAGLGPGKQLKYSLDKFVPLEEAKQSTTFVLLDPEDWTSKPDTVANESQPTPTGLTITEDRKEQLFTPTEKIMLIIGLVFVLGLVAYYFVFSGVSLDDIIAERYAKSYLRRAKKLEGKAIEVKQVKDEYSAVRKDNDFIYASSLLHRASDLIQRQQMARAFLVYKEIEDIYPKLAPEFRQQLYHQSLQIFEQLKQFINR